ncbi:hypothetical protein CACET_c19240 [Clostridium aceticum]|uniref:Uncharacterized protein n=1 Tax=Clostridium aceticum TaxID=84022 RepID=A0A0D8II25_9CLOT|nr:hypothetical protein [Clostridium aceticum]AKL95372.1 hypothetical protein CACET_c19240 [Clostridium aceticum]KJF28821.1 hypothetical protein TZ02_00255 [Clostridium aceticum]
MKLIAILIVFITISFIDLPKLLKHNNRRKYIAVYFTLVLLGFFLSVLQIFVEFIPGPMLILRNFIKKI